MRPRRAGVAAAALGLAALTLAGYLNSFPGAFIWDDWQEIVANPLVAAPDLRLIFTTDYCGQHASCGTYRPLAVLSYALNRGLFGPGPASFHAVNVLLHAMVTLMFALTLRSLGLGPVIPWLAAALFGLHPIHTEAVNIVTYRTESLAALGVMVGLWASRQAFSGSGALVAGGYAFALLSKESGLTFLLLLPLCDLFRAEGARAVLRRRWRLYAALAAVTVLWLIVHRSVTAATPVPRDAVYAVDNPLITLAGVPRLLTALKAQLLYLGTLVFPARLQAVYAGASVGVVTSVLAPWGAAVCGFAALAAAATAAGWRRGAGWGLGIPFYAAAFAVSGNFLFPVGLLFGERLAYLPSAGYCLAVASVLAGSGAAAGAARRRGGLVLAGAYLVLLGVLLVDRNREFADAVRLSETAVRLDPGSVRAWYFLGGSLQQEGRTGEAEQALRQALAIDPSFPDSYTALAGQLLASGRAPEAIELARQGIAAGPQGYFPRAYWILARGHAELGETREALRWLEGLHPTYPSPWEHCGLRSLLFERLGDLEGAAACYLATTAVEMPPDALLRLSYLLRRLGRPEEAEAPLQRAEALVRAELAARETPEALNSWGSALALRGRYAEAREAFRRALALDPASADYRANFERAGRFAAGSETQVSPPPP